MRASGRRRVSESAPWMTAKLARCEVPDARREPERHVDRLVRRTGARSAWGTAGRFRDEGRPAPGAFRRGEGGRRAAGRRSSARRHSRRVAYGSDVALSHRPDVSEARQHTRRGRVESAIWSRTTHARPSHARMSDRRRSVATGGDRGSAGNRTHRDDGSSVQTWWSISRALRISRRSSSPRSAIPHGVDWSGSGTTWGNSAGLQRKIRSSRLR